MQINLNDDDAQMLHFLIDEYLPQLRMEVARTDSREYRRDLVKRQELCERLLLDLEPVQA
jgi:hypothetical protein